MLGNMTDPERPILSTPDGSKTAYSARFGEAYSSVHGAASQAQHVFVVGSGTDQHPAPQVLEIGFGLGINFRTTLAACAAQQKPLHYLAYEFDPAPASVLAEVAADAPGHNHPVWQALLERWPQPPSVQVAQDPIALEVRFEDVTRAQFPHEWATALYLDGFSPSRNPEIWTEALVKRFASALATGGVLTTYSAAGQVRRALQAAGLEVQKRPGPPGKRECLRAVKV